MAVNYRVMLFDDSVGFVNCCIIRLENLEFLSVLENVVCLFTSI